MPDLMTAAADLWGLVDPLTIKHAGLTLNGDSVTLPWRDASGAVVYATTRFLSENGEGKYKHRGGKKPPLYAPVPDCFAADRVVLTESQSDALVCIQGAMMALATAGGTIKPSPDALAVLKGKQVTLVPDNDEAGQSWLEMWRDALAPIASVSVARVPFPNKDLGDFARAAIAEGRDPAEAVWDVFEAAEPYVRPLPFGSPVDLTNWLAQPVEPLQFLAPHLLDRSKILVVGDSESAKSLWTMAQAADLSRSGVRVVYASLENAAREDHRRLTKLHPDPAHFVLFQGAGIDLADPEHVEALMSLDADLYVFDSFTHSWSGDDNDNSEFIDFDRTAWTPLRDRTGAAVVLIDHPGHEGRHARGASAKKQKSDVTLIFDAKGPARFSITEDKMRGGVKQPPVSYRVIDTDDGGLSIEPDSITESHADAGGLNFAERRILDALAGTDQDSPLTVQAIGDRLKNDSNRKPYRRETISRYLAKLATAGCVNGTEQGTGRPTLWWLA